MTTLLLTLTIDPANQTQVTDSLRDNIQTVIATLDGWVTTKVIATTDESKLLIYSEWRDAAAVKAMQTDPRMLAYYPQLAALATIEAVLGDVVYAAKP
jgi:quinol monooxygenase YgiN